MYAHNDHNRCNQHNPLELLCCRLAMLAYINYIIAPTWMRELAYGRWLPKN